MHGHTPTDTEWVPVVVGLERVRLGEGRYQHTVLYISVKVSKTHFTKIELYLVYKNRILLQKSSWTPWECMCIVAKAAMQIVKVDDNMPSIVVIKITNLTSKLI